MKKNLTSYMYVSTLAIAIIVPHALLTMNSQTSTIQSQTAKTHIPFRQPTASPATTMPLTAKNLTLHTKNQLSQSPNSAFKTPSKKTTSNTSSASTYWADFGEPTMPLTYDQLNAADDFATPSTSAKSSRSNSRASSSSSTSSNNSIVQGGIKPYTMKKTFIDADGYQDDLDTVDLSIETESIKPTLNNNVPTGLMFNFNASQALAQAGKAFQKIPGQIYDIPGGVAKKLYHPDGKIITGSQYSLTSAGKALYNALPSQESMYTAAKQAGKALQAIPRQMYDMPGGVARKLYHPDGKIITGNSYSVSSAGKSLYTMAENTQNSIKKALTPSQARVEAQSKTRTLSEPEEGSIIDPMKNPDISGGGPSQSGDSRIKNKNAYVGYSADEPTKNVDLPVIRKQKSHSQEKFWDDDMHDDNIEYDNFMYQENAQALRV